jgi:hypothetical protein
MVPSVNVCEVVAPVRSTTVAIELPPRAHTPLLAAQGGELPHAKGAEIGARIQ